MVPLVEEAEPNEDLRTPLVGEAEPNEGLMMPLVERVGRVESAVLASP